MTTDNVSVICKWVFTTKLPKEFGVVEAPSKICKLTSGYNKTS